MSKLCKRRCQTRDYIFFIIIFSITGIQLFISFSIVTNEFDYSTVIYPSPFDTNHTNFLIYLNKKDHLSSSEDQLSFSKHHKILDNGLRTINKTENFLLIEYTKFFGYKKFCTKKSIEIFGAQCPYKNCFYSCNRSLASQAQLLIFHKYDVTPKTVPPENFTRNPSQIWLFWHDAPNFLHRYNLNIYKFNWTISYVFNAEASIGAYGMTIIREKAWTKEKFEKYIFREFSSRYHQALWFVKNCGGTRRLKYFRELRKYFPIQVFGTCVSFSESLPSFHARQLAEKFILSEKLDKEILLSRDCSRRSSCEKQMKLNMFYLAFESHSCKNYITETFWRALKYGLIPSIYLRILFHISFSFLDF
jgi:galactoside alpha-1,3-fucosyltransferase 4